MRFFLFYLTKHYRLLLTFFTLYLHIYVLARIWRKKINTKIQKKNNLLIPIFYTDIGNLLDLSSWRLCCQTCALFATSNTFTLIYLVSLDLFVEHVLLHEQETRLSCKVYYIRCKLWLPFTSKAKQTQVKFVTLIKSSNETYRRGISYDFTVHIIEKTRTAARYLWDKAKLGPKSKESRVFESQFLSILPWITRQCKIQDGGLLKKLSWPSAH